MRKKRLHLWLIGVIGIIVPQRLRADWRQEWEAELRHREILLTEWDKLDGRHRLDLLRRSLGAFWDALLLQPKRWEDEMVQDLRFGVRMLLKSPVFTLVALGTLALGIGANAVFFSVVNAVLLRPLPYPEAERIVRVFETTKSASEGPVSPPNFLDWREQSRAFEQLAAYQGAAFNLVRPEGIEQVQGLRVSAELFPLLGVAALHGRTFLAEEDRPGAERVVMLSHALWLSQFGSDVKVIGQPVRLGEQSYTVIGVLPPDFEFYSPEVGLWAPLAVGDASHRMKRTERYLQTIARLRPGSTLEQAQAEMNAIAVRLAQAYPDANANSGVQLVPLQQHLAKRSRDSLLVLFGAVGFVLLIACANVANLLLARAVVRHKELAVRLALGASRLRVTRQLLTESLLLSLLGGLGGLWLAYWGTDLLIALLRSGGNDFAFAIARLQRVGIDGRVLGFTLLVSLATGLIFGLAPAWQVSRLELNQTLKGVRGKASGGRFRQMLVVAQTGLALVLLVGAGLFLKSFWRLSQVGLGFDPQHLLTMQIAAPPAQPGPHGQSDDKAQAEHLTNFFRALVERVKAAPGVTDASLISFAPLASESTTTRFTIAQRPPASAAEVPTAGYRVIDPGYFQTLQVPLLQGRHFTDADTAQAPAAVIINEAMARRFWPGESPLNQRLRRGGLDGFGPWYTVVGVVQDVKTAGPEAEVRPELYIPHAQFPWPQMTLVARTAGDPAHSANELRAWIRAFDKTIVLTGVRPLEELLARARAARRFNLLLLGAFAGVALLLAVSGVYGVLSYAVAQRAQEIGIRLALGAQASTVQTLIVRQGLALLFVGIVLGLAGAFALTRVLKTLLFEVSATDPVTFVSVPLLLLAAAWLACWLPARRAAQVDPLTVLRHE
jgi:putative ABC transport system permease protein